MKSALSTAFLLVVGLTQAYLPAPQVNITSNPKPPSRKDIDTLRYEELVLYVLAIKAWQNVSAKNTGGYFQVAGIHGAPHTYWDNAGGFQTTSDGDAESGYCFHGDQNFYLWHRPYLALFEQQIRTVANNIANAWYQPQRATYQSAASTLRLPYWDWAKSSVPGTVPSVISSPTIQIANSTTGQNMTIANPLYSHTLVSDGNLGTYSDGTVISVGPKRTTYRGSTYLNDMKSQGASLKRNTALLFNTPNTCWNVFATENSDERNTCSNQNSPSMEGTHNTVHNTIGGTMVDLDISAFDPIFWLHHCNVDRIGALWNAINPNTKVVPTYDSGYTWVVNPGTRDDSFPLEPFRYSNGNTAWWQPKMLYDTRANGYTYPELADQPSSSTVLSRVNAIYGNGRTQSRIQSSSKMMRRFRTLSRRQTTTAPTVLLNPPTPELLAPFQSLLINANGSFHEYAAICTVQKSVAPGKSFTLHLFFGDVTTTNYLNAPNRVGSFSVSQAAGSNMTKTVSGVVPITDSLLNVLIGGKIQSLKPGVVRKYVNARLVWRLVTADGQEVPISRGRQNGLQIRVQHTLVTPPEVSNALPVVTPPEAIADTTNNTVAAPIPSGVAPSSVISAVAAATSALS